MSAKEMFEQLGYKFIKREFEIIYQYTKNEYIEDYRYIKFDIKIKKIELGDWQEDFNLSLEELQAINKQVEELGWNER